MQYALTSSPNELARTTYRYFALRGIREKDPNAKVLIIGEEDEIPYMRTPLSKELWFKEPSAKEGIEDMTFTDWGGEERCVRMMLSPCALQRFVSSFFLRL